MREMRHFKSLKLYETSSYPVNSAQSEPLLVNIARDAHTRASVACVKDKGN